MKISQLLFGIFLSAILVSTNSFAAPRIIEWEDLVPTYANTPPMKMDRSQRLKGLPSLSEFDGSQEDMDIYVESMEVMREMQPDDGDALVMKLNDQEVKIAGYVTPLTFDGDNVVDFLFVPYLGACIHVPPPGANQIVYVENAKGLTASSLYDPVWLSGKLKTTPVATVVADVGYTMSGAIVEPYDE